MKNVTITVEDDALEWARVEAAKRNTSVSKLVGSFIAEMRRREDAYTRAYHEWKADTRTWTSNGQPYPKRDEIYERGGQRE
jgi:hypothetical protein